MAPIPHPFPFLSDTAMVLAAGLGVRMRPLTEDKPKPLLTIGGRTMLDRALDHLRDAGVRRVVVNGHYLANQIKAHLDTRTDIETIFSPEESILDTGGGVKKALPHFGGKPFFLLGGDMPWVDGVEPALHRLASHWNSAKMDELLLLYPTTKAKGFDPEKGDFMRSADGRAWRKDAPLPRDFVWISAQIVRPQLYDEIDAPVFSNNLIFDRVEERERLYGVVHDGACYHVGTPADLAAANHLLETGEGWG